MKNPYLTAALSLVPARDVTGADFLADDSRQECPQYDVEAELGCHHEQREQQGHGDAKRRLGGRVLSLWTMDENRARKVSRGSDVSAARPGHGHEGGEAEELPFALRKMAIPTIGRTHPPLLRA